jgi:hypothetical protein
VVGTPVENVTDAVTSVETRHSIKVIALKIACPVAGVLRQRLALSIGSIQWVPPGD